MAAISIQKRLTSSISIAQSGTGSDAFEITGHRHVCCQVTKTGVGQGTAKLQESNDGITWHDVNTTTYPNATATLTTSNPTTVFLSADVNYAWVRVLATESGTAAIVLTQVLWNAKIY